MTSRGFPPAHSVPEERYTAEPLQFSNFRIRSGQDFDPLSFIAFQISRNAFEKLVNVQTEYYHCWGSVYCEGHEKGQRQNDQPGADQIQPYGKSGAAASADDPVIGRHLIGHSYADNA